MVTWVLGILSFAATIGAFVWIFIDLRSKLGWPRDVAERFVVVLTADRCFDAYDYGEAAEPKQRYLTCARIVSKMEENEEWRRRIVPNYFRVAIFEDRLSSVLLCSVMGFLLSTVCVIGAVSYFHSGGNPEVSDIAVTTVLGCLVSNVFLFFVMLFANGVKCKNAKEELDRAQPIQGVAELNTEGKLVRVKRD